MSEKKEALRNKMRKLVRGRQDASARDHRVAEILEGWELWREARTVCAFAALPGEPDILRVWPESKRMALPRVCGDQIVMHWVSGRQDLQRGRFGILEPSPQSPPAGQSFDLIVVPGLAFDRTGGRLGRGKGFYDRFFASAKGLRVGVCFDDQVIEAVPMEAHDVRMDAILTPTSVALCDP